MKALRLEDGMELKIVPIIRKNGSHTFTVPVSSIYYNEKRNNINYSKVVYDEHNYLDKLYNHSRYNHYNIQWGRKNIIFVWHDGEIKMIFAGKSIYEVILKEFSESKYSFMGNRHLKVVQKMIDTPGGKWPDYKSSHFIDKDWIKPTEEKDDWINILKNNDVDNFLNKMGVLNNLNSLNQRFDNFFSNLIADGRNKKLEELGI